MVERKSSKEEKLLERNCEKEYSKKDTQMNIRKKIRERTFERKSCTIKHSFALNIRKKI